MDLAQAESRDSLAVIDYEAMVTRNENAVTFSVQDEDHTLANPVRFMLNKKCAVFRSST